eukprot:jgi/Antlo1/1912/2215
MCGVTSTQRYDMSNVFADNCSPKRVTALLGTSSSLCTCVHKPRNSTFTTFTGDREAAHVSAEDGVHGNACAVLPRHKRQQRAT